MRSSTPEGLGGRCPGCFIPHALCLCAEVPRVETRTQFLLVRHAKELRKSTNTARIAALAMPNLTLMDYGLPGAPFPEEVLAAPGTWVLFPGEGQRPSEERPSRLVVLDGTWAQARRILHRLPSLQMMPRLSFERPAPPLIRLRRPHFSQGMSTLEAIAEAVEHLEGEERAAPLRQLNALMVQRVLRSRGR
jgi:DTW domain-containing protein